MVKFLTVTFVSESDGSQYKIALNVETIAYIYPTKVPEHKNESIIVHHAVNGEMELTPTLETTEELLEALGELGLPLCKLPCITKFAGEELVDIYVNPKQVRTLVTTEPEDTVTAIMHAIPAKNVAAEYIEIPLSIQDVIDNLNKATIINTKRYS